MAFKWLIGDIPDVKSKGIGELGISGAGAAVINAISHATGHRVYDYPALPDRVLSSMGV